VKRFFAAMRTRPLIQPTWETTRGKGGFLRTLPPGSALLDVGCGNGSPHWFKAKRPDLYYVGLDIGDYRQFGKPSEVADEYILVPPEQFASSIEKMTGRFDAVVSSHNIEHCAEPMRVFQAMLAALKPGGRLFLSTPCSASTGFPHREGTLNFFDDPTHVAPVELSDLIAACRSGAAEVEYVRERYRPFLLALKGLFIEPTCYLTRKVSFDGATWALYGFESIIWVRKSLDQRDGVATA
jgi:SAM-dependent methyltransferase